MTDYPIIVTVSADDWYGGEREAFDFVRNALAAHADKHEDLAPDGIRVSTPDGTLVEEV